MPGPPPRSSRGSGNGRGRREHRSRSAWPQTGDGIPLPISSFVGRAEAGSLIEVLGAERLVTLSGPPGVGKSRLAAEVASIIATEVPDGAWWFDLAALPDAESLATTMARTFGVHEQRGTPLLDTLARFTRGRRILVVLDNCEHLLAASAAAAQALLEVGREVTVLATSRQLLGITGERRWDVGPLSVPDSDAMAVVAGCEAGRLFCARAAGANAEFALSPETAPAVAAICRRLDGLPLAIELAASRTGVLSVGEIAARLDDRFALLRREAPAGRHRSLAAALDWSYELLTIPEKALFRRLGVFRGSAGLDAIEAVCAGGVLGRADVLDTLASLVAKSLVVARTAQGPARYRLLESLRAYAGEHLVAEGEGAHAAERHGRWCLRLAASAEAQLTGPDQLAWLDRLDLDHPNLRAAFGWTLARPGDDALALASSLTLFWRLRGQYSEGWRWLMAAVEHNPGTDPAVRARGLWGSGFLATMLSSWAAAEGSLAPALSLYRRLDDVRGQARCHLLLGSCRLETGDLDAARALLDLSAAQARDADDPWCLTHALALAARAGLVAGDQPGALGLLGEAVAVSRAAGDVQGLRIALALSGQLALAQGRCADAVALVEEALTLSHRLREPYGIAGALDLLGQAMASLGDAARARAHLDGALAILRVTGPPDAVASVLCRLGLLDLDDGMTGDAAGRVRQAAEIGGPSLPPVRLCLGELALADGKPEAARGSFEEALRHLEAAGHDAGRARALDLLGVLDRLEGQWARAAARHGQALDIRHRIGDARGRAESLEALGGLAACSGEGERAVRLLGAADAERQAGPFVRTPRREAAYRQDLDLARDLLAPDAFDAAWAEGAATTPAVAVQQVRSGGNAKRGGRPSQGWDSLTRSEREVALLLADGLTNPQIAQRLFVSRETVKSHVAAALAKLGFRSRVELAKDAARRGISGPLSPS